MTATITEMNSSMSSSIFTSEDLINHSNRLHVNTVISSVINTLAIYSILFYSTKAMGNYKWYLLNMQFAAFIFDFHLTECYGPVLIPSIPAICSSTFLSRQLPPHNAANSFYFFSSRNQFILIHLTFAYNGLSTLYSAFYRYFTVKDQSNPFNSKKTAAILAIFTLISPIPVWIPMLNTLMKQEEILPHVLNVAPEYYHLFDTENCGPARLNTWFLVYVTVVFVIVIIVLSSGFYVAIKMYSLLMEKKALISQSKYDFERQLLIAIVVQCVIPVFTICIPCFGLFLAAVFRIQNIKVIMYVAFHVFSFHSTANGISLIFIIKPYRDGLLSIFKRRNTVVIPGVQKQTASFTEISSIQPFK